ncbi:hypothetical protein [Campylobacter canadensis]|uniref:Tetratricopeptide repeat-like domain-containing protein n=1 Tax=Campylobacter canadensis TaxID=449520 RepID=A0ABS7WS96_9BACT|nr:hypothetical protein [Campylobacter canadensis]MBZ7987641.1 hypothetical protein [Campylobacter canadensis]MBZ7995036.1 hypothetical protein [Campylobacter canadensis]MBZ7996978.1 hypothetical protein [Campylobacter canadensis]MBZ7998822.1 hypothetical protein [Campylobacter canadensis]MBZ8000457.1 hypothetical protein [Campylobacter canadensis]
MKENSYAFDEISIRLERFFRKYKFFIIVLIVLFLAVSIGIYVNNKTKENNFLKANELFLKLEKNYNEDELKQLKSLNSNLYLALIMNDDKYKKELSEFKPTNEDALLIQLYESRNFQSEIFLKDIKLLNQAYALLQENKITQAKDILELIPTNSIFYQDAQRLKHYQGK